MEDQAILSGANTVLQRRDARRSIWRGLLGRCPNCGEGHLFGRYLKVCPRCAHCSADLSHQRADDMPAYVTMVIVGHLLVFGVVFVEDAWAPPIWVHLAIWLPLATILSLLLLPRMKGAIVGLQWAARMHGFADTD